MISKTILEASYLVKVFGAGRTAVRAVDGVSLGVRQGEIVLIMGPSGSGKTTLLSMLGGLLRPTSGRIVLDGDEITAMKERHLPRVRARSIGFVFQAFHLLDALSAADNVLFPCRLVGRPTAAQRRRVEELLERLGLQERRHARPRELSGGEKQRVAVARALINDPPLILADEPTGNLDSARGQEVMMILHDIARDEDRAVVIVTHDPRLEEVADRIMWLEDGHLRDRKEEAHELVQDPVCGMSVDPWTSGHVLEHGGARSFFCSQRCLERFRDDPLKYLNTG